MERQVLAGVQLTGMEQIFVHWLPTWFVSAIPATFVMGCALSAVAELRRAGRLLGGELRGRDDLDVVQTAIVTSLRTGAVMATVYGLFLVVNCGMALAGTFSVRVAIAHVVAFSVLLLPLVPVLLVAESRLKRLEVVSRDPSIGTTYETWLREWRELRVNLSEPPPARVLFPRFGRAASRTARAA